MFLQMFQHKCITFANIQMMMMMTMIKKKTKMKMRDIKIKQVWYQSVMEVKGNYYLLNEMIDIT